MLKNKNLLHMGCRDCGKDDAYLGVKVLNKMKVQVEVKEFQCGCEFLGMDEAKIMSLARENEKLLKDYKLVVVGCARCYHVLKKYYNLNVKHILEVMHDRMYHTKREFHGSGEVFYHDPCYLARFEKVMEDPRRILWALGYHVKEFAANRERTDCCGDYSPIRVLRDRNAEMRLSQLPPGSIVTAGCPKCIANFAGFNKANSKIKVKHFLELVDESLGIEIPTEY